MAKNNKKSMKTVNPKYLIALALVLVFAFILKISNPNQKYSTEEFWESATIEAVYEVPVEALEPGNKNGPVLMWAAMVTNNPGIIAALVQRGADVNESDSFFMGTPLTGAAIHSKYPEIIDELIYLGADINKVVHNRDNALSVAARHNKNQVIVERLIFHGADPNHQNFMGMTALDIAIKNNNTAATDILVDITDEKQSIQNEYDLNNYTEILKTEHKTMILAAIIAGIIITLGWAIIVYFILKTINKKIDPSIEDQVEEKAAIYILSAIVWPAALIYGYRFLKIPEKARTGRACIILFLSIFSVTFIMSIALIIYGSIYLPEIVFFLTKKGSSPLLTVLG